MAPEVDALPRDGILRRMLTAILGPLTGRNLLSWLAVILLVLGIRWAVFEPYTIPTGSMEPTLHGDPRWLRGDRVGVNKYVYGLRVPFMNKRLYYGQLPQRWDIVVFKSLDANAAHPTLVKRIVGLPGERIQIREGRIWVNDVAVEPPENLRDILNYTTYLGQDPDDLHQFALQMAVRDWRDPQLNPQNEGVQLLYNDLMALKAKLQGVDPATIEPAPAAELYKSLTPVSQDIIKKLHERKLDAQYPLRYGVFPEPEFSTVPEGHYLVCGDNSLDSADGRYFGWLPNEHLVGRVFCVWWPLNRWRDFTGFSHTWWGRGILFGVPMLLVAYQIRVLLRRKQAA